MFSTHPLDGFEWQSSRRRNTRSSPTPRLGKFRSRRCEHCGAQTFCRSAQATVCAGGRTV